MLGHTTSASLARLSTSPIGFLFAKTKSHLVGEHAGNDHAIGLARVGPEDDAKAIEIVSGGTGVHHLDSATSEAEGHGSDGAAVGLVHEVIDLGDHVLCRLGEARGEEAKGGGAWA